jgi:hypothetical protein
MMTFLGDRAMIGANSTELWQQMYELVQQLLQVPEWRTAAAAIIIGTLSWVGIRFFEWRSAVHIAKNARLAKLVELHSLLRAGRESYELQQSHMETLSKWICKNHTEKKYAGWTLPLTSSAEKDKEFTKEEDTKGDIEDSLSESYYEFYPHEMELHNFIRSITINTIRPVNKALLQWLKNDTYFKGQSNRKDIYGKLAEDLANLEAHLLQWPAKYEVWVPNNPQHVVVYMADEKDYGVPFPQGLENVVAEVLKEQGIIHHFFVSFKRMYNRFTTQKGKQA